MKRGVKHPQNQIYTDLQSKLQVTNEGRTKDIEPPDGPQMQIADVSADGHFDISADMQVDSTDRQNTVQSSVEPLQKKIADISADVQVDSTDRQNTVQSSVEPPQKEIVDISADVQVDSTDRQNTVQSSVEPPQKEIADISADVQVDSTDRQNTVQSSVEPPQKEIADISADVQVDSTDRQNHKEMKCANTVQSNVEPPHVRKKQISADGNNHITDQNEELQVTYEVQSKNNTKTQIPVAVRDLRDLRDLNNPTNVIEIVPHTDVPQHTVQLGHKRGKNRSVCTVNPVKPVSTTDDGECLQYIFIKS